MHGCKSGGSGFDESIYFALQKHDCAAAWAFPRLSAHVGCIPGLGTLFIFELSRGKPTLQGCCPIARLRPSYQNRKNLVDGKYFACIDFLPIQEGGIDGQAGDTYTQSFGLFGAKMLVSVSVHDTTNYIRFARFQCRDGIVCISREIYDILLVAYG